MQPYEIKSLLAVTPAALLAATRIAHCEARAHAFEDTDHRARMRLLLDGAGLTGSEVLVAFLKKDGSLRYMRCVPVPGADVTARYVTVLDLELPEEGERSVYRRVCLDAVAGVTVRFRPM